MDPTTTVVCSPAHSRLRFLASSSMAPSPSTSTPGQRSSPRAMAPPTPTSSCTNGSMKQAPRSPMLLWRSASTACTGRLSRQSLRQPLLATRMRAPSVSSSFQSRSVIPTIRNRRSTCPIPTGKMRSLLTDRMRLLVTALTSTQPYSMQTAQPIRPSRFASFGSQATLHSPLFLDRVIQPLATTEVQSSRALTSTQWESLPCLQVLPNNSRHSANPMTPVLTCLATQRAIQRSPTLPMSPLAPQ